MSRPVARARGPLSGREGMTLLELLVVMAIVATMFGVAVGSVSRTGKAGALDGAARTARAYLKRARVLAMKEGALSRVTFTPADPERRRNAGFATQFTRVAGTWHFDDPAGARALGGEQTWATVYGGAPEPDGRLRGGLRMTAASRVVTPPLTEYPGYDPSRGFSLFLDIRPDEAGTIARFGEPLGSTSAWIFRLESDGSLTAELETTQAFDAAASGGDARKPRTVALKTGSDVIERGQWARVGLVYDGVTAEIVAHGVSEASALEARDLDVPPGGALILGGGLAGVIDEAVYQVAEAETFTDMEGGVDLAPQQGPVTVRFDRYGKLNEKFHDGPVAISLVHEGRTTTVTVEPSGVVR
ncbi:MAG TPA: prepilin-type N-terminal cleavage/methylation domain-containing protein [Planctomycetota bacterium]|nr:prepilin-type N-terminal cleavage/methylation domain-containing protein [Planctomycetota bacterium]